MAGSHSDTGERLRYQRCGACGHAQAGASPFCVRCGQAALSGHEAGGGAQVASVTVVHRAPSEAFRAQVPYTLVLVDADEGFRMLARLRSPQAVAIGQRVRLRLGTDGLAEVERR